MSAGQAELPEGVAELLGIAAADVLEEMGPGEVLAGLREAEQVTAGLMVMAENLSPVTYLLLGDAHERATAALGAVEGETTA